VHAEHTMSHHHTYYVTSSYILCHIIMHTMSNLEGLGVVHAVDRPVIDYLERVRKVEEQVVRRHGAPREEVSSACVYTVVRVCIHNEYIYEYTHTHIHSHTYIHTHTHTHRHTDTPHT